MKYKLTHPCPKCPFRNDIRPYINSDRVLEIVNVPFSCHETTTSKNRENDHPHAQHCAGSLILHEKLQKPHQMMRIMERLGEYDYKKLDMDAPVYDDLQDMYDAHLQEENK